MQLSTIIRQALRPRPGFTTAACVTLPQRHRGAILIPRLPKTSGPNICFASSQRRHETFGYVVPMRFFSRELQLITASKAQHQHQGYLERQQMTPSRSRRWTNRASCAV